MDEEECKIISDGEAVKRTVNTDGWKNVIRPALDESREAVMGQLLEADKYEELVKYQQQIKAIDGLFLLIESKINQCDAVLEEEENKKKNTQS